MKKSIILALSFISSCCLAEVQSSKILSKKGIFEQPINDKYSPVKFKIIADFSEILKRKIDAQNDMEDVEPMDASVVDPQLQQTLPIKIKARGNSILADNEANFPKLHIQIEDEVAIKNSIFAGTRKFRINTHISDQTTPTGLSSLGRLLGEQGPVREGLGYEIASLVGLIAPQTRLAEITYVDSKKKTEIIRKALLIETDGAIAKRNGAEKILDFNDAILTNGQRTVVDPDQAALFMTVHKLLGNEDFALKMYENQLETGSNRYLWNTFLLKTPNGKYLPVIYDLDLATIVTGRNAYTGTDKISKTFGLNTAENAEFAVRFAMLRQKLKLGDIRLAIQKIMQKKTQIIELIQSYPVDSKGRDLALGHLKRFEELAESTLQYNITTSADVRFYSKPNLRSKQKVQKISSNDEKPFPLRPGTPVKILNEDASFYYVEILDLHHDLPSGESKVGYILKTSAIGTELPEELLGYQDERDL